MHLRFGPVARGGLRWSDRREDFRTEILGLVKAQMVKNAVIVPVGAKGGFVAKRLPDPPVDRDAWLAEGIACYRTFISCLLDLTDNYVTDADGRAGRRAAAADAPLRRRRPVPGRRRRQGHGDVQRHRQRASRVDYGFWLGDAFATGGSVGYDHKAMGITARGAWESVKYHFRELGHRHPDRRTSPSSASATCPATCSATACCCPSTSGWWPRSTTGTSSSTPIPDAGRVVRRAAAAVRAAALVAGPTTTPTLISDGGGVFPRTLKSIPISPQVARRARPAARAPSTLTPTELIHAILLAPVDLLWNGGIGTYVKASTETAADVGDKANDARAGRRRPSCACRVVGEGGNLGFTQLGRIEYARAGGRINTDAIDNSAGVDTSDHEVNLKILLDRAVAAGSITARRAQRAAGRRSPTTSPRYVLRDNYEQNVLLGMAAQAQPGAGRRCTSASCATLESAGELDRAIEFLPVGQGDRRPRGRRARPDLARELPSSSPTPRSR